VLKERVITGLILVSISLWAFFSWPTQAFFGYVLVLCTVGAYEWAALGGLTDRPKRIAYAAACALLVLGLLFTFGQSDTVRWLNAVVAVCWIGVFFWLHKLHRTAVPKVYQVWSLVFAPLVMCGVGLGMVWLRDATVSESAAYGPWLLLYVLAIAWFADVGAYFCGKAFGKRKLSLVLSPGKSIEGALGGLTATVLLAVIAAFIWKFSIADSLILIAITLVSAVYSIGGDLFESSLKRSAQVKDSGWILPGHGGVLDRVDSPLASVPVFVGLSGFLPF